jgi:hypothetical protein
MTVTTINGCILFPHMADWSTPPTHKRTREVDIATGILGAETRQSPRPIARRQISFLITPACLPERARLEARWDAAAKCGFGCAPLHGRYCQLAANANAGANTITIAACGAWNWQAGDYVILLADDQTFDIAAVVNVAGNVLTLATNLNFNWPAQSLCWPVIFGAFTVDKETALDGWHGTLKITIAELTSARAIQIGVTPAAVPGIGQVQITGTPPLQVG